MPRHAVKAVALSCNLALGTELGLGEDPTMCRGTAAAEPIPV
jgi:hypothetical protein